MTSCEGLASYVSTHAVSVFTGVTVVSMVISSAHAVNKLIRVYFTLQCPATSGSRDVT